MTARGALIAAVLFGIACRVAQYAAGTSLFHDEAFVALNVRHVAPAAVLGPLDWHEPSPPGFLLLEQLMVAIGGDNEWALRAVPLLAGIAAMLAFAALAWRACLSPWGAALAVLLLASSDKLIGDASLVKHYSLDLLAAIVLVAGAWSAHRAPSLARLLGWSVAAAMAPWLSYASAFVIAGGAAILLPAAWRTGARPRAALAAGLLTIGVSALVLYGAVSVQRSDTVVAFWSRAFPPFGDGVVAVAVWLVRAAVGLCDYLWRPLGGLLLIPLAAAMRPYRSERLTLLALLWLPVATALVASCLHWWPFGGTQHMAFTAPAVLLPAGDGLALLGARLARRRRSVAALAGVALLGPAVVMASYHLVAPRQRHELRPLIAIVAAERRPGDQLAVFDAATYAFYTGVDLRDAPVALDAPARLWVITPRSSRGALHPDIARVVEHLRATREPLAVHERHGAAAYLFDAPR